MNTGRDRESDYLTPDPKDWLLDKDEIRELEEHLDDVTVDTDHDIPYAAGYSLDGHTIFIDRAVPQFLKVKSFGSKTKLIELDIWKCFAVHEAVEKSLEDDPYNWKYKFSHQVALRAERAYVQSMGADWNDYNDKTLEIVDEIYARGKFPNIPANLDPAPYLDYADKKILKQFPNAEKLLEIE